MLSDLEIVQLALEEAAGGSDLVTEIGEVLTGVSKRIEALVAERERIIVDEEAVEEAADVLGLEELGR